MGATFQKTRLRMGNANTGNGGRWWEYWCVCTAVRESRGQTEQTRKFKVKKIERNTVA